MHNEKLFKTASGKNPLGWTNGTTALLGQDHSTYVKLCKNMNITMIKFRGYGRMSFSEYYTQIVVINQWHSTYGLWARFGPPDDWIWSMAQGITVITPSLSRIVLLIPSTAEVKHSFSLPPLFPPSPCSLTLAATLLPTLFFPYWCAVVPTV